MRKAVKHKELKKVFKKSLTMQKRCDIIVKRLRQGDLFKSAKLKEIRRFTKANQVFQQAQ